MVTEFEVEVLGMMDGDGSEEVIQGEHIIIKTLILTNGVDGVALLGTVWWFEISRIVCS